jgi:hypothetical protein
MLSRMLPSGDRAKATDQLSHEVQSTEANVDDRVYWVKALGTGERHYAFIVEDRHLGVYTIWFFTAKKYSRSGTARSVVLDYKNIPDHDTAESYLTTNGFEKVTEQTSLDMPSAPIRLNRKIIDAKRHHNLIDPIERYC